MSDARLEQRLRRIASTPALSFAGSFRWDGTRRGDGREARRETTFKFALITVARGNALKCIVRDMSGAGARIAIEGAIVLPQKVQLRIPMIGFDRLVEVRWQRDNVAGLRF